MRTRIWGWTRRSGRLIFVIAATERPIKAVRSCERLRALFVVLWVVPSGFFRSAFGALRGWNEIVCSRDFYLRDLRLAFDNPPFVVSLKYSCTASLACSRWLIGSQVSSAAEYPFQRTKYNRPCLVSLWAWIDLTSNSSCPWTWIASGVNSTPSRPFHGSNNETWKVSWIR